VNFWFPRRFGPLALDPTQTFLASDAAVAVVNLKPLAPGHVLVLPRARGARLADLDDAAHASLWRAVRAVRDRVCAAVGARAATLAVQDGAHAGQSVPHVHVHVLPRPAGGA